MRLQPALMSRPWLRRLFAAGMRACAVLFVVGLAVRLSIADRVVIANTIYYATPWSVLAVLGALTFRQLKSRPASRFARRAAGLATLGCAVAWGAASCSWKGGTPQPGDLRVLTWNLGHGNLGLSQLATIAAQLDPDIALFVEADPRDTDVRRVFRDAFPDRHVFLLGGGIVLVSRWPGGEARATEFGTAKIETRFREIELETPWGEWTVFGCDFASNVLYQRRPHLQDLADRVAARTNPVLIAGDFNTPGDSPLFEILRGRGLREAFDAAGRGYRPTWPVPCPVLSLDQIWLDARLRPVRCERYWHWRSDHAAVLATIRPVG